MNGTMSRFKRMVPPEAGLNSSDDLVLTLVCGWMRKVDVDYGRPASDEVRAGNISRFAGMVRVNAV